MNIFTIITFWWIGTKLGMPIGYYIVLVIAGIIRVLVGEDNS